MFNQSNTAERFIAAVRSHDQGELDLAINLIQDMSVRSPPYSAFGSKINPVLTIVAAGPCAAQPASLG